jgi:hypothetical protein
MLMANLFLNTLRLLSIVMIMSKPVGGLILAFDHVFNEAIIPFVIFAAIVLLSFELAITTFYLQDEDFQARYKDEDRSSGWLFGLPVGHLAWLLLSEEHPPSSEAELMQLGESGYQYIIGLVMMVAFFMIAVLILLNLLIAMMNTSYERVTKQYERDYGVFLANYVALELRTRGLPDPFNWFSLLQWPFHKLGFGRGRYIQGGMFLSSEYVNERLPPLLTYLLRVVYPLWVPLRMHILRERSGASDRHAAGAGAGAGPGAMGGSPQTAHTDSVELQSDILHATRTYILHCKEQQEQQQHREDDRSALYSI